MDYNYNGGGWWVGSGGSVVVVVVFGERVKKISSVRRFSSVSLDTGYTGWLDFTWDTRAVGEGKGLV